MVQPWKFINIQNVKDGILELLLEIECPQNLFMVPQCCKFTSIQNMKDGILELLLEIECPHNLGMVLQSWKWHKNQEG